MNQPRRSIRLVSFAAASLAAVACGHDVEVEEPAGTTQTTSAEVAAAPSDLPAGAACSLRSEAAEPAVSTAAATRPRRRASPSSGAGASHELLESIALAAGPDESPLDEAIETSVRGSGQNATRSAPEVDEVATTGATVPRGEAVRLAPASVAFANRLPDDYRLERVRVIVDGATSYDGTGAAAVQLAPGGHVVQVIADYRLSDPVFSYVRGYRMEVRRTGTVAASSTPLRIVATAVPTGGVTTPMNKRATLAWRSTSTAP